MGRMIVLGAGGHAKVVISTLRAMGHTVEGVFDDSESLIGKEVLGVRILGTSRDAATFQCDGAIIAIGNPRVRKKIAENLPLHWEVAIHPSGLFSPRSWSRPGWPGRDRRRHHDWHWCLGNSMQEYWFVVHGRCWRGSCAGSSRSRTGHRRTGQSHQAANFLALNSCTENTRVPTIKLLL